MRLATSQQGTVASSCGSGYLASRAIVGPWLSRGSLSPNGVGLRDRLALAFQRKAVAVRLEGARYRPLNWSPSGFQLEGYHRDLRPRDRLSGTAVAGPFGPPGTFVAQVVRVRPAGPISLRFIEISPELFLSPGQAGVR